MTPVAELEIDGRRIGTGHPCYVIAEAGLNHNGDLELAKRLIDMAVLAGADAVKFQKRTVAELAIKSVLDAADDRFPAFGKTYGEIRNHLEFGWEQYLALRAYCDERQITFMCTPFDIPAADFLQRLGVSAYKVASHSLTNHPLLDRLAGFGTPVIMSTGMCTLLEIDAAVETFSRRGAPLMLLHCVSSYPQAPEESNLSMIRVLSERYGVPVGYSGHEIGTLPTLASVAIGAVAVERHITLDKTLVGFDHKLSLEPHELIQMVRDIRVIDRTLGNGEKSVSEREVITRRKYHVSIVSARDIEPGETLTVDMLTLKNPGTGLAAGKLPEVVGRRATRRIPADMLLEADMFE